MKWISADYIKALMKNDRLIQGNCECQIWEQAVEKLVDSLPLIDIVQCKECIWFDTDNTGEPYCMSVKGLWGVNADDYCSFGERRE